MLPLRMKMNTSISNNNSNCQCPHTSTRALANQLLRCCVHLYKIEQYIESKPIPKPHCVHSPDTGSISDWLPHGAPAVSSAQGAPIGSGVVGLQLVGLLVIGAQAAAVVLQAVGLRLEALGLRAIQVHAAAAHGHLRLRHMAIVVLADGQRVAVFGPVATGHVGRVARRGAVVEAARQTAIVVGQVAVAIVQAVVVATNAAATILAVGRVGVRVGTDVGGVVVVRATECGAGMWRDVAVAVLQVAPVDGVRVAAQRRGALRQREAIWPQRNLPDRPRGHRLH